eukprot:m.179726 g.179726  ORF g.179726 m.179726 type:complete len:50 (+) comp13571_c0_seq7:1580-1729(+)
MFSHGIALFSHCTLNFCFVFYKRVFVDHSSVEVFAFNGRHVLTRFVFVF